MKNLLLLFALILMSCGHHISKSVVMTDKAPKPIGPYSQAVIAGNFIYVSGQIGINPTTGEMVADDIKTEAKQVMENIGAVLKAAGSDYSNIVKTTIYLKDINDFKAVNEVYSEYFKGEYPARETVGVASLPKNARVEISVIALRK
jgi:2-iminobutanoate/2-iminopropanoate deaminase